MHPTTSRIATGSFMPDSPSSVRASRRGSCEPRSTANTAAASVAATVEPSSSAGSGSRSRMAAAATAVRPAVATVPTVASAIEVRSTGRISLHPEDRPPSKRISARATMPAWRASSKSLKSIQPVPSVPISIPTPSTRTRPGIRSRPAASEATSPADSSRPVINSSWPSCTGPPCQTPAAMRILGVLHPGGGSSGLLADRAGPALEECMPGRGDALPGRPGDYDALVVFGGGMNVRDADRLPWLRGEIELLREALAARTPLLGICLGAQLLAAAAGAEVRRADAPEIGWFEVARAGEDPVLGALPPTFTAYEWHSYTFELPAGAVELARSAVCPQAFRIGQAAWGVQFHPEVTPAIVREWALDYESDPDAVRLGFEPQAHIATARDRLPAWMDLGRALFDAFLSTASAAAPRSLPG